MNDALEGHDFTENVQIHQKMAFKFADLKTSYRNLSNKYKLMRVSKKKSDEVAAKFYKLLPEA